jgi:hypothetical protein
MRLFVAYTYANFLSYYDEKVRFETVIIRNAAEGIWL